MTKDQGHGFCSKALTPWELILEPQVSHVENETATSPMT